MTFAEELVRETDKMKADGKTPDEIAAYVDQAIADWNMKRLKSQMIPGTIQKALA
jgi:hypothetical protein